MSRPPRIVAASLLARAFRLLPYRRRLGAAVALSRFVPVPARYRMPLETRRDAAARIVVRALGYAGLQFAADHDFDGFDLVREAYREHGSVILVSAHLMLAGLFLRRLDAEGYPFLTLRWFAPDPPHLLGADTPQDYLVVSPQVLVQVRSRLRRGTIVILTVDSPDGGTFNDTILHFAERIRVPVLFFATRVRGGRIVSTVRRPAGATPAEVIEELRAFLTPLE
ncbi:MAG: hypothetical protein JO197_13690 [Acidobacteria bacterium]|nr:hypothetical protein [Acidobacteriota bacterium]MBV9477749.1 hypothetical protein [Acidobacteriota bacterium]